MPQALGQGGTSFDALYVNVNGESGYFDRSLHAYGRRASPAALRYADPAGRLHEPLVVLLPGLPAGAADRRAEPAPAVSADVDRWPRRWDIGRWSGRSRIVPSLPIFGGSAWRRR